MGKSSNPADQFRKEQRKKELKKQKQERNRNRELKSIVVDGDKLKSEIKRMEELLEGGKLDQKQQRQLIELKAHHRRHQLEESAKKNNQNEGWAKLSVSQEPPRNDQAVTPNQIISVQPVVPTTTLPPGPPPPPPPPHVLPQQLSQPFVSQYCQPPPPPAHHPQIQMPQFKQSIPPPPPPRGYPLPPQIPPSASNNIGQPFSAPPPPPPPPPRSQIPPPPPPRNQIPPPPLPCPSTPLPPEQPAPQPVVKVAAKPTPVNAAVVAFQPTTLRVQRHTLPPAKKPRHSVSSFKAPIPPKNEEPKELDDCDIFLNEIASL